MRRWLVISASVAIVLVLARAAGFATIAESWRTVQPWGIATSVACWHLALGVRILSWRVLLGRDAPPLRALAPPLALGFVLSNVAPAKSGEPAAAWLVRRSLGVPLARALSVLTAERSSHVLLLLATFAPATAVAGKNALGRIAQIAGWLLLAACLATLVARPVLRAAETVATRIPRVGAAAVAYLAALRALLADPRRFVPTLSLAFAFWLIQYASLFAILRAGGLDVNPVQTIVVSGSAILGGTISLLPLGTQDAISALALGAFGVPLPRGFALALFHSALSLACAGVTAAALAWRTAASRRAAAREENGSPSAP